ncbi:hypothetical protein RZO50_14330 [Microbacterium sp. SSW1-59]|uniref:hypothetical protein n=1 Tax=Microbacterium xanthum TaxID=3079794 RepID=UPI002AD49D32|nr:hypothetical protein [Microbacterium sp. SSW1-59]MDZ8202695.1 hypothetical protein [Microbacterium sp. SSW1-59]
MSVDDYVTEDGTGLLQDLHVRDLLPPTGTAVKLLLILESPHAEELVERTPVVGGAGQSAIEYLLGRPGGSLGEYVDAMHAAGDFRVGVMNVSNVPLQRGAYDDDAGPLTPDQWEVIRVVRESPSWKVDGTMTPEANRIGLIVQAGLQSRISRLAFEPGARVALCGDVVQRFARGLTGLPGKPLKVYHPSRNQWMNNPDREEHKELRDLFLASTAPLPTLGGAR